MHDVLVLEQLLNGLEGLASLEVANAGNEFLGDVLVVTHADFDGREDAHLFFGDEMQVLTQTWLTEASNFIV